MVSAPSRQTIGSCGFCDTPVKKVQRCGRCKVQLYCGVDCQRKDWSKHKIECVQAVTIPDSSNLTMSLADQLQKCDFKQIVMKVNGLYLFENAIPQELHDEFVILMNKGKPQLNRGLYDSFEFNDKNDDTKYYEIILKISKLASTFVNLLELYDDKNLTLAVTVVGYAEKGYIDRHIDSDLVSKGPVLIFSFNSPRVVNFYPEKVKGQQCKIFIKPKSVYITTGEARYGWSHAILANEDTFEGKPFERNRRYAVVMTKPGPFSQGTQLHFGEK